MDFFAGMFFTVFVLLLGGWAGYLVYAFLKSRENDK
jgi:hypothetical protein|nr:MAG TPA: multi-glycosylated core protein [Caudoviricetes sp.]